MGKVMNVPVMNAPEWWKSRWWIRRDECAGDESAGDEVSGNRFNIGTLVSSAVDCATSDKGQNNAIFPN